MQLTQGPPSLVKALIAPMPGQSDVLSSGEQEAECGQGYGMRAHRREPSQAAPRTEVVIDQAGFIRAQGATDLLAKPPPVIQIR